MGHQPGQCQSSRSQSGMDCLGVGSSSRLAWIVSSRMRREQPGDREGALAGSVWDLVEIADIDEPAAKLSR